MNRMCWTRRVRQLLPALAGLSLLTASPLAARPELTFLQTHDEAACARPALWVVSDADTTIYLFGTIHTHDGRAHWFDHAVRRAFDASSVLVMETLIPEAPPRPIEALGTGLMTARATVSTAREVGLTVQQGADMVLARAAKANGKPIVGLESFEEQLRMYQSLPSPARPTATAASVVQAAAPDPAVASFLLAMVERWNAGDAKPIEAIVGEVRRQSPETYQRLFADRNAAWAKWIARRLDQPGILFVAVGTGHLVGEDSVQAKLAELGVRSGRVN